MKLFMPLNTVIPRHFCPFYFIAEHYFHLDVGLKPVRNSEGNVTVDVCHLHSVPQIKLEHGTIHNIASLVPHGL